MRVAVIGGTGLDAALAGLVPSWREPPKRREASYRE